MGGIPGPWLPLVFAVACGYQASLSTLPFPFADTFPISDAWGLELSAASPASFAFALVNYGIGSVFNASTTGGVPWLQVVRVNATCNQSGGVFLWNVERLSSCSNLTLTSAYAPSASSVALRGTACGSGYWTFRAANASDGHVEWQLDGNDGRATPGDISLSLILDVPMSAPLIGLGTQYSALDLRGARWPVWSQEQGVGRGQEPVTHAVDKNSPGSGGSYYTTYSQVPLLYTVGVGSAGTTALWIETLDYMVFDLFDPGKANVTVLSSNLGGRVTAGKSVSAAVASYTLYSGRPPFSPAWVNNGAILGLEGGTAAVLSTLSKIDAVVPNAPIAGVWMQDWCGNRNGTNSVNGPFYGVYWSWELNTTLYPGWHDVLLPALASRGARVLAYINPQLMKGPLYDFAEKKGYLVLTDKGQPWDFGGAALVNLTMTDAASWYSTIIQDNILSPTGANASGWMADFGEGFPINSSLGQRAHGSFPAIWAAVNAAVVNGANEATYFMRSSSPRSPGLSPHFWLGDQLVTWDAFDGLATAVVGLITSSLFGAGTAHSDIGGYTSVVLASEGVSVVRSKELFMRWAELAAFTFMFRTHLGSSPGVNWQLTSDDETIRHFFAMTNIYVDLAPYRAAVAFNASLGSPVYRCTAALYPAAPWNLLAQFFLGDDLLVAPVLVPGAKGVAVWFPLGTWRHALNSSLIIRGTGDFLNVSAPIGVPAAFWRTSDSDSSGLGK